MEQIFDVILLATGHFRASLDDFQKYRPRVGPLSTAYYHWDYDQTIGDTVLLSRLIRPTTMGASLAARLYFKDAELQQIVPGPTQGNCSHAYVVADDTHRDWLSLPEMEQLRSLLSKYDRNANERVRLARRHIDTPSIPIT